MQHQQQYFYLCACYHSSGGLAPVSALLVQQAASRYLPIQYRLFPMVCSYLDVHGFHCNRPYLYLSLHLPSHLSVISCNKLGNWLSSDEVGGGDKWLPETETGSPPPHPLTHSPTDLPASRRPWWSLPHLSNERIEIARVIISGQSGIGERVLLGESEQDDNCTPLSSLSPPKLASDTSWLATLGGLLYLSIELIIRLNWAHITASK